MIDSVEDDKRSPSYGGEYGTQGTVASIWPVMRQPGSNTIEVVDNIKRLLPQFRDADSRRRATRTSAATAPRTFASRSRT